MSPMQPQQINLPSDPNKALAELRHQSKDTPVWVFKQSPICPVSHHAQKEFEAWLEGSHEAPVTYAVIDVIAERDLARGLTKALDIKHESPQGLFFRSGELAWHGSHADLTKKRSAEALADAPQ